MTRFLTSRGARVVVVAAVATGGLLIGGVANADTAGGSSNTGTGSPVGGLDVNGLVGPVLDGTSGLLNGVGGLLGRQGSTTGGTTGLLGGLLGSTDGDLLGGLGSTSGLLGGVLGGSGGLLGGQGH